MQLKINAENSGSNHRYREAGQPGRLVCEGELPHKATSFDRTHAESEGSGRDCKQVVDECGLSERPQGAK